MLAPLCEVCGLDTTPSYFLEYIVPVWLDVQPLARLSACKISLIEWLLGRQGRLARCSHTTRARPGRNEEINPFCAAWLARAQQIAWVRRVSEPAYIQATSKQTTNQSFVHVFNHANRRLAHLVRAWLTTLQKKVVCRVP